MGVAGEIRRSLRRAFKRLKAANQQHGFSVHILIGYLSPPIEDEDVSDWSRLTAVGSVRIVSAGSPPEESVSAPDAERLKEGCTGIVAVSAAGERLAESWILVGRQYPHVLERVLRLPSDVAYMFGVLVHKSHRGRGIGGLLIGCTERLASSAGARSCFAWVERQNRPSRAMLKRRGWCAMAVTVRWRLGQAFWFGPTRVSRDSWIGRTSSHG